MGVLADTFLPFPWPLTIRQDVYLFGMQGLTAMCVDFGANFGIAYVYHHQPHVKMWVFAENTIAGDLGVTPLIQCAVSMVITSTLVHTDLHHRAVKPLPFVYPHVGHLPDPAGFFDSLRRRGRPTTKPPPPKAATVVVDDIAESSASSSSSATTAVGVPPATTSEVIKPSAADAGSTIATSAEDRSTLPSRSIAFYLRMFLRFTFEGTEHNMLLSRGLTLKTRLARLGWTILQGLAIGVVFGLPFWCLAVVILGPIYGTGDMGDVWAPQAIKGVYGGLLGLVTNPVIAALALGSQAEHHLIPLAVADGQAASGEEKTTTTTDAAHVASKPSVGDDAPHSPEAHAVRRGSVASSRRRPSITANPSTMTVLVGSTATPRSFAALVSPPSPTPAAAVGVGNPGLAPAPASMPGSPARPPNRPRAGTTASEYSLGGTGGRAQRPRANSRASILVGDSSHATFPANDTPAAASSAIVSGSNGPAGAGTVHLGKPIEPLATMAPPSRARAISSASAISVRSSSSAATTASTPTAAAETSLVAASSAVPGGVSRLLRQQQQAGGALETPRESLELREDERVRLAASAGK